MVSRRVWWVFGIIVVLVALTLFGVWGRWPEREGTTREVAMAMATPARSPEPVREPTQPAAGDESPTPEPVAVPEEELPPQVRRFLEANVYPPTSRPLTEGATDQLYPNQRYEKSRPLDEDGEVTFVFTADRYYYTGDDVALVWLEVVDGGQPADVDIHQATARAEERGQASAALVDLGLQSDGVRWSSALNLAEVFPDHHGTILLEVVFEVDGGDMHAEAIRIFSTPPDRIPAQFTGEFRDSIHDGSLLVEVGVDVLEPGFFRFDANLYDRNGEPVAFAVFKGDLEPGDNWLPLEFFGKILHDQGAMGPYTVEQIRGYRFLEGQTPDRERLADNPVTHQTSPYEAAIFSDAVYASEHKERMVQLMLDDIDAGRTLDAPPVASKASRRVDPGMKMAQAFPSNSNPMDSTACAGRHHAVIDTPNPPKLEEKMNLAQRRGDR